MKRRPASLLALAIGVLAVLLVAVVAFRLGTGGTIDSPPPPVGPGAGPSADTRAPAASRSAVDDGQAAPAPPTGRVGQGGPSREPDPASAATGEGGKAAIDGNGPRAGAADDPARVEGAAPRGPASPGPRAPPRAPTLSGRVFHSDGTPLRGVRVEVVGTEVAAITDASGRFELPANLPQDATLSVLGGALTRTVQESASNADFLVDAHVVVFRVERLPGGRLGGGRWAWTALRSQIQVVGTGHGYGELDSDSVVVRVPDGATWVHLAAQSPGHEMATDLVRISGAPRVHHEKCHVRPLADDRAGTIVLHPVDPFGGEPGVLIVSVLEGLTGLPYDGWISREVTAEAGQGIRLEGIPADTVLVRAEQAVAEPGTSLWVPTVAVVRVEAGRSHEVECRMRIGGRVNLFVDEARLPGTRLHELQLWDRRGKPVMIFGVAGSEGPIAAWDLPGRRPVQDAGISRGWSASFLALPGEYVLKVVPSASADARPTREFEITVKEAEVVELELK